MNITADGPAKPVAIRYGLASGERGRMRQVRLTNRLCNSVNRVLVRQTQFLTLFGRTLLREMLFEGRYMDFDEI